MRCRWCVSATRAWALLLPGGSWQLAGSWWDARDGTSWNTSISISTGADREGEAHQRVKKTKWPEARAQITWPVSRGIEQPTMMTGSESVLDDTSLFGSLVDEQVAPIIVLLLVADAVWGISHPFSSPTALFGTITVLCIGIVYFFFRRLEDWYSKKIFGGILPPFAPGSMMKHIEMATSGQYPWWLLVRQRCGCVTCSWTLSHSSSLACSCRRSQTSQTRASSGSLGLPKATSASWESTKSPGRS